MNKTRLIFFGIIVLVIIFIVSIFLLRNRDVETESVQKTIPVQISITPTSSENGQMPVIEDGQAPVQKQESLDYQKNKEAYLKKFEVSTSSRSEGEVAPTSSIPTAVGLDSDRDGLSDNQELQLGTDINRTDTDGDGLSDYAEVTKYKTNPRNADSDGDGFKDGAEVLNGYNPLGSGRCARQDCSP